MRALGRFGRLPFIMRALIQGFGSLGLFQTKFVSEMITNLERIA
jgi:hypothetical protein